VDAETLVQAGLIREGMEIKILGAGRLKRRLTVEAHAFSASAREAIEKAGGTVTVIGGGKAEKSEEAPQASE
jgi:large subunit ribosomal protein L15